MATKKSKAGSKRAAAPASAADGKMIGFRVPLEKAERANGLADREGLTLSQVLRVMLDEYLAGRFKVELRGGPVLPFEPAPGELSEGGEHD